MNDLGVVIAFALLLLGINFPRMLRIRAYAVHAFTQYWRCWCSSRSRRSHSTMFQSERKDR